MKQLKTIFAVLTFSIIIISCETKLNETPELKWAETDQSGFKLVANKGGKTLSYSPSSGVHILTVDGFAFKDLNRNNQLDVYEDWRKSIDERAKNLASLMSLEQIAGLMLYSSHQSIPARDNGYFKGTYSGKSFEESGAKSSELTDQQKSFLRDDNLKHVLITAVESAAVAAEWNNNIHAFAESLPLGIPVNNSSDPRHGTIASSEYNAANGGSISMWPTHLGMAATFNPEIVERFGEIASKEYRALGVTTALSPQVDIATDPRWARVSGTFGENPYLGADLAQAYVNGFQGSGVDQDWGNSSVNAMVKHWPGGGSGEGGRDAHYGMGKFAVYPGNNFEKQLIPFTEGAFKLNGKTKMASAVMPYYTISWNQSNEQVANGYNKYLITDLLREKYNYDGVVCTDWLITHDYISIDQFISGKPWGVESLSVAERHYKILMAGVDQFGGNNDSQPIIDAYAIGVKEIGETAMRARMEKSAVRLLKNIFQVGVFENPYLVPEQSKESVGNVKYMKEGFEAQQKSVVMLKNKATLPIKKQATVYVPKRFVPESKHFLGFPIPSSNDYPVNLEILKNYFNITNNPDEADVALVFIENPKTGYGYDAADVKTGGNGYVPMTLQYGEYTATEAREKSIAGGDPLENFNNRTYKNKTVTASNITDLQLVKDTHKKMKGKPVVVSVTLDNPMVFSEFEHLADAILIGFRVQDQALFNVLCGDFEPSGLLPLQMPLNMKTVEKQAEDMHQDMECYKDSEGNIYDFAFGLNWGGVIKDERTTRYKK